MKRLIAAFAAWSALAVQAAEPLNRDEAELRSAINSFAVMADQGAFDHLGRLMAPQLTVDYSALFGGEPQQLSNTGLMGQWAAFLPGFDTTFHQLSEITLSIDGDDARAQANFSAEHWLDDGYWQVSGRYRFQFVKTDGQWRFTYIAVEAPKEQGSRELLAEAPLRAKANQANRTKKLLTIN